MFHTASNRHRGNATVSILITGVLLVSVATLILVYLIYDGQNADPGKANPQANPDVVAQGNAVSPANVNQNPPSKSGTKSGTKPAVKPVVHSTHRSPLPQPGEVIDKPLAPSVLAVPAPLTATAPAPKDGDVIPWSEAKGHIGRTITVEGKIVQANNIGSICFLNFTNEPRGGDKFYMVVFKDKYQLFGGKPEVFFKNKTVRVKGEVEEHKGRPQMKIKSKDQVQVLK